MQKFIISVSCRFRTGDRHLRHPPAPGLDGPLAATILRNQHPTKWAMGSRLTLDAAPFPPNGCTAPVEFAPVTSDPTLTRRECSRRFTNCHLREICHLPFTASIASSLAPRCVARGKPPPCLLRRQGREALRAEHRPSQRHGTADHLQRGRQAVCCLGGRPGSSEGLWGARARGSGHEAASSGVHSRWESGTAQGGSSSSCRNGAGRTAPLANAVCQRRSTFPISPKRNDRTSPWGTYICRSGAEAPRSA